MKKKFWFIASVREEVAYRADGSSYVYHDSRCWGFYSNKKKAIKAVEENWTDMNEAGYYPYAVIEEIAEGLLQIYTSSKALWFKACYDNGYCEYKKCETPEFAKGIVGWTIS